MYELPTLTIPIDHGCTTCKSTGKHKKYIKEITEHKIKALSERFFIIH